MLLGNKQYSLGISKSLKWPSKYRHFRQYFPIVKKNQILTSGQKVFKKGMFTWFDSYFDFMLLSQLLLFGLLFRVIVWAKKWNKAASASAATHGNWQRLQRLRPQLIFHWESRDQWTTQRKAKEENYTKSTLKLRFLSENFLNEIFVLFLLLKWIEKCADLLFFG